MNKKQRDLLERLIDNARMDFMLGCPAYPNIQSYHRDGKPLPDKYLPGRTIMNLTDEERKLLEGITGEDIAEFRLSHMGIYPSENKNGKRALEKYYNN